MIRIAKFKAKAKYGNRRVEIAGEKFDSAAEANRFWVLQQMQIAGTIRELTRQVSFVLAPGAVVAGKKKRALTYSADFQYVTAAGKTVVEDKKGALTEAYKIKRHLMKTVHNIDIKET